MHNKIIKDNSKVNIIGSMFQGISALLSNEGIDNEEFYQEFNLHPNIEQDSQVLISFEILIKALDKIKVNTSIKHPGLYLASHQAQLGSTPYINLILAAPTVEIAFQLAKRYRYVFSEVTYWDWLVEHDFAVIKRCSFVHLKANDREHCLYTVATVFLVLKRLFNGECLIERISLIQPADKHRHEIEKFFNCSISFSQDFDGFILSKNNFYKPNHNFDAEKYHQLLNQMACNKVIFPQNQSFVTFIKMLIVQMLSTGHCSLESIAKHIGMHPRMIQKKLQKENVVFKDLVNDVRMNTAKRLLRQADVSLLKISSILGYSEASAFSRAFQTANQCTPRQWRKERISNIK